MDKIFRIGHRTPSNGVITIASKIVDDEIYYGASYCAPHEKTYSKQFGIDLANIRMNENIEKEISIRLRELKHSSVIIDILSVILHEGKYPKWAEEMLYENMIYPVGLYRYSNNKLDKKMQVPTITVNNEWEKEQLLLASKYLFNLKNIDLDFIAVNVFASLHHFPYNIEVK